MSLNSNALCSVDNVNNLLDKKGVTDEETHSLELIINGLSQEFENYCDRIFKRANYIEYIDGDGSQYLYPVNYPLVSVSSIYDDSDWVYGANTLITATEYGIIDGVYVAMKSGYFSLGTKNIKITYSGGYTTIPADLILAATLESAKMFKNRKDINVVSRSISDGSINFEPTSFLPAVKQILDRYKRVSAL